MSKQEQTRKTYKLPDGKITSSPHRYAREWLTICRAGDFIAWLAREFDAWEMDNEPPHRKEA